MMLPEPGMILIVDDDRGGREALEALLLSQGYHLVLASSGPEALQKLEEVPVDLVMLDVMMPGMDGYEVCRRIRNTPAIADIPILILTAMNDFRSRLAGFEVGADDYIAKPYDSLELFARVRTVSRLNRYRRLVAERMKFQQLFDLSPNGQLVTDDQGTIQLVNKKLLQLVHLTDSDEIVGATLKSWITSDHQAEFLTAWDEFWKDPTRTSHFVTWLAGKNDLIHPVEIVLGQIEFNGKKMAQAILIDIRERMQLSGALAKERALLKAFMEAVPDFVYCKDLESRFLLVNQAMARFFGLDSAEDVVGKTDFDFFPKEQAIRYFSDELDLFKTGKLLIDREEAMLDSKGIWHWMAVNKAPLFNHNGDLIGLIGFARDITLQKNALIEFRDVKSEMENSNAKNHELQSLVQAIQVERRDYLAYFGAEIHRLGLVIQDSPAFSSPGVEKSQQLEQACQAAESITGLTQDILEYSRLVTQIEPPNTVQFLISEVIDGALRDVKGAAEKKGLRLAISLAPAIPAAVFGDSDALSQVLARLLLNAIRAADTGEISIKVDEENYGVQSPDEDFYIHFAIRFSGAAISKEEMPALFQPFRIPSKTGNMIDASGLSLAICKKRIEILGGRIWAESEGISGGSTSIHFTFQLYSRG